MDEVVLARALGQIEGKLDALTEGFSTHVIKNDLAHAEIYGVLSDLKMSRARLLGMGAAAGGIATVMMTLAVAVLKYLH